MMKKKKLAFFIPSLTVGGVEKSLLDLIDALRQDEYEITIFVKEKDGAWEKRLKNRGEIRRFDVKGFKEEIRTLLGELRLLKVIRFAIYRLLCRYYYKKQNFRLSREYLFRSSTICIKEYDAAIAYQMLDDDCVLGALFGISAAKRIAWLHGDCGKNACCGRWYMMFDKIFCVSKYTQIHFAEQFPEARAKTEVLYNNINSNFIVHAAEMECEIDRSDNKVTLVTVGRLSKEKGQNLIPHTARLLIDSGCSVRWYIIGDGPLRETVETEIADNSVEDAVTLLGRRDNPYPYIKACDIYVQTSLTEGWGLTVSEAKILRKPIVTTDAGVMSEQIRNGINGTIVKEATSEALALGIEELIHNAKLREEYIQKLCIDSMLPGKEVEKLYRLLNRTTLH